MKSKPKEDGACPCGAGDYAQCCGRFIGESAGSGAPQGPQTALELMRSRYTAHTLQDEDYLQASWHASTRPVLDDAPVLSDIAQEPAKWLGLEIRRHVQDGDQATVEFVARYKVGGRAHRLHETSRFVREDGRWFYVDGTFPDGQ